MKGSIIITRNVEDVFDFLSRPENLFDLRRNRWISFDPEGPVSAGSVLAATFTIGPFTTTGKYEVILYERPFRLAFRITQPTPRPPRRFGWLVKRRTPPPMEDVIELKAALGGTRLSRTFSTRNPISRVLDLLLSPLANWGMRRDLRRLKALVELELP